MSFFDYETHKAKNGWRIVDPHIEDGATSVSLLFVPIKTANPITLKQCDYAALCLPEM